MQSASVGGGAVNSEANWAKAVYSKTGKAHEELAERQHGLKAKARQLLVLLDGNRPLGALSGMMPLLELQGLVRDLLAGGFIKCQVIGLAPEAIYPIQISPVERPDRVEPPHHELVLDPVRFTRVKAYLIETSQQHLGLMATKLQQEIAEAQDAIQLRSALAHWNMAIRESNSGSDVASAYLKQAYDIIGWT